MNPLLLLLAPTSAPEREREVECVVLPLEGRLNWGEPMATGVGEGGLLERWFALDGCGAPDCEDGYTPAGTCPRCGGLGADYPTQIEDIPRWPG